MAYLPPPIPKTAPARRRPRWHAPKIAPALDDYVQGNEMAVARIRRMLAVPLAQMVQHVLPDENRRIQISQNAVSVALAVLVDENYPHELVHRDPVEVVFTAVAYVIEQVDEELPPSLDRLPKWEQAIVRLFEVELADEQGVARAFALDQGDIREHRLRISARIGVAPPRAAQCPGWSDVVLDLRARDDGAMEHRERCGRCSLAAEQTVARRRRLWPDGPPPPAFAPMFDPRVR